MIRASVIGLAVSAILAATVASMAGCDSSEDANDATSAETIKSANVALTIQDENGNAIGNGSGILIAPKLVLTAAHLVAGQSKWKITAEDGSTRTGVRGLTYDWMEYNSDKAHPRRHDVAVIYLDKPITLGAYPRLGNGTGATRLNAGTSLPTALSTIPTFPHAFITDMAPGENLDTGGAVLDEKNHIVGVVTGRGLTTGKLYIARTDQVNGWVSTQTHNCHSGSSSSSSSSSGSPAPDDGLHVHTYQPPPESSSGTTSSSSGTTSSSSGTTSSSSGTTSSSSGTTSSSSGTTSSSSGTTSSSSGTTSSSSGDVPPGCTDQGDGHCYGPSCDQSSSSSSSSSSSGSTSSSSGTTSSGSSGPSTIPLPPGTSSGSTSGSTGSSSGTTSSGSSGPSTIPAPPSSSGQPSSTSGNGSSSGNTPPGGDACQGPNDDSEKCPHEPDGCTGYACGGGSPDDLINYGNCACGSNPPPPDKNPNVK